MLVGSKNNRIAHTIYSPVEAILNIIKSFGCLAFTAELGRLSASLACATGPLSSVNRTEQQILAVCSAREAVD